MAEQLIPENRLEYWLDEIKQASGGGSGLPDVTSADNGKVLGVEAGAWSAVMQTKLVHLIFDEDTQEYTAEMTGLQMLYLLYGGIVPRLVYTDTDNEDHYCRFEKTVYNGGNMYLVFIVENIADRIVLIGNSDGALILPTTFTLLTESPAALQAVSNTLTSICTTLITRLAGEAVGTTASEAGYANVSSSAGYSGAFMKGKIVAGIAKVNTYIDLRSSLSNNPVLMQVIGCTPDVSDDNSGSIKFQFATAESTAYGYFHFDVIVNMYNGAVYLFVLGTKAQASS